MKMKKMQIEQLSTKIDQLESIRNIIIPSIGWIKTIRTTLGMSLEQLGKKMGIAKSNVQRLEKREQSGTITLKTLEEAGKSMDMKFIYGFVPKDGSIEKLIERKAKLLATEIVLRTSGTMKLEDQENSQERIKKAIEERTSEIIDELPKILWD